MEKIFEDKEFHGTVKFFKDVVFDKVVKLILKVTPLGGIQMTDDASWLRSGSDSVLGIYKSTHDWWGALAILHSVDDPDDLFAHVVGTLSGARLNMTAGTFSRSVEGIRNESWINISGGTYTDSGLLGDNIVSGLRNLVKVGNDDGHATSSEAIPHIAGAMSEFVTSGAPTSTVGNYYGWLSLFGVGASLTVTNAFGFYSKFAIAPVNGWHFYGLGDYPSYFGGKILQLEKDITAATPPTQAEMVSALGAASAHVDASLMVKVTDGSHFRVFSDGTSWFYSAYTVGA